LQGSAWIQIHKIPPLYHTESILQQLAGKVGEVIGVEIRVVSTNNGDFHRARVKLHANAPLARAVTHSPEGSESMLLGAGAELHGADGVAGPRQNLPK
jgi:hypothetical protein